jgi:superfamily II DNA/RNA helicase
MVVASLEPLTTLHYMPFSALGLHAQILKAVQEAGYTEPTPIQAAAIPQILAGHDLIGIAQTGTGKTAAFVLPILTKLMGGISGGNHRQPRALVVAPTRELAAQIEENVLIFSRMKHGADRLARQLEGAGVTTATLHSNRSQNQRLRALKDFKSGAVRVLVATDIAARGIDVDDISHVVNYDFPMHPEDYVHRIGRTGRAHAIGDAISFVTPEDHSELRSVERFIGRGLVRKRAEGFNYAAASSPSAGAGGRPTGPKPAGFHPKAHTQTAPPRSPDRHKGFRSGRARQWNRHRRRG